MTDCIFCKIIAKEIPSTVVYEDADVYAFLDISPVQPGHTLVVPKTHGATLLDVSDDVLAKTIQAVPRVARAMQLGLGFDGFNVTQNNGTAAGQSVHHLHMHIIPRYKDDGLEAWPHGPYASLAEAQELAQKIREQLS
jgi:histidine triad (HIT) family protein